MPHYIEQLIKLHSACYAISVLKYLVPLKTLVMIHYAYFHSRTKHGITRTIIDKTPTHALFNQHCISLAC